MLWIALSSTSETSKFQFSSHTVLAEASISSHWLATQVKVVKILVTVP